MILRISTHMLDTSIGKPAAGVQVVLEAVRDSGLTLLGRGTTDIDGRVGQLNETDCNAGRFRITFLVADYFAATHDEVFYPQIVIDVLLDGQRDRYHIPVLASTFSYSTYLGS